MGFVGAHLVKTLISMNLCPNAAARMITISRIKLARHVQTSFKIAINVATRLCIHQVSN